MRKAEEDNLVGKTITAVDVDDDRNSLVLTFKDGTSVKIYADTCADYGLPVLVIVREECGTDPVE